MKQYDERVDIFIGKAPAFAQPILQHIRQVVHEASPLIVENIKWSCPFFEYKGIVCMMNAFKEHCSFGFWDSSSLIDPHGVIHRGNEKESAGNFGRITKLSDLPGDEILKDFILQLMALNEKGQKVVVKKPTIAPPKTAIIAPDYFIEALNGHPKAKETFEKFSPSHKKEYLQWIIEAKTDATRRKRMAQAFEMMSEGKSRHWKYAP